MADILINSDLLTIGTDYTPNTAVNKFITLSNVSVSGTAMMPEKTTALRIGNTSQVWQQTAVDSVQAMVVPQSIAVDAAAKTVTFEVAVQVKYHTCETDYLETQRYTAVGTVNLSGQMSAFTLDSNVTPYVKSVGSPTVVPTLADPARFEIQLLLTTGAFTVTASGQANVRVPLAVATCETALPGA